MITLLCVVLVSGIGAMVISAFRAKQRAEDLATSGRDLAADISEKVEEEVQRAIKDAQRAAEEAANSASPPPGSEASIDLDKYKYPNTTTDNQVRVLGNEILNLGTKDSYDEVKKFYQQLLGEPVIESNENDEQKLVFQSAGKPSVLVTIQPDKRHFGHLQIVVIRSHIQFPKLDSK
ncbi:MAG: hypothetical protein ACREAB_13635 [Blastocatellia bacterium]